MKAVKFIGNFLAVLFSAIFALLVLLAVLIGISKTMFTQEAISNYVVNADIFNSTEGIGVDNSKVNLEEDLKKKLLEYEISEEVTNEVIKSPELNKIITTYIYNYYDYVLFEGEKIKLQPEEFSNLIQDKYISITGKSMTKENEIKLDNYAKQLVKDIEEHTPDIMELEELGVNTDNLSSVLKILNSKYMIIVLIGLIMLNMVLVAVSLWNREKTCKLISAMLITDGIILIIFSILEVKLLSMMINSKGIVENLVITIGDYSIESLLFCGIICILIGLILLIICSVLLRKDKKENQEKSDKLLKEVIKEEVSSTNETSIENKEVAPKKEELLKKANTEDISEKEKIDISNKDVTITGEEIKDNDSSNIKEQEEIEPTDIDVPAIKEENNLELVPVPEEQNPIVKAEENNLPIETKKEEKLPKTIEYQELEKVEEQEEKPANNQEETVEYKELNDDTFEEIKKKDVNIVPITEIDIKREKIEIEKGKDITLEIKEDEEEIEIL